ncbi:MAG TPA: dienelactone hydrolase family protein [Thermoanaerobaculia bacterium]|jgi:carboxymethylenebutenolidase
MRAGMIDMESNTTLVQNFPAHEAMPDGRGPFPAVVIFHDRFGLSAHVRGVANRLARAGFYALAPNFYALPTSFASVAPEFMRGLTVGFFDYADEAAAVERAATLTDERAEVVFRQAFRYLATRSRARSGPFGVLGFSMGGRLAFLAACVAPEYVRACVGFYPAGLGDDAAVHPGQSDPLARAGDLLAPLRLFFGRLDTTIRDVQRERIRSRLMELGRDFRIEVFPEAGHDFFCSERQTYRIRASKVAWEETLALFGSALGGF